MKLDAATEEIVLRGAISAIAGGAATAWAHAIFSSRVFALVVGFLAAIGVWVFDEMTEPSK